MSGYYLLQSYKKTHHQIANLYKQDKHIYLKVLIINILTLTEFV